LRRTSAQCVEHTQGPAHPDFQDTAAVLVDPFGNEFEVTNYHG
jgi:hypothetical protein